MASSSLSPQERMTWDEYRSNVVTPGINHLLLDVRPAEIAQQNRINEPSLNIPFGELSDPSKGGLERLRRLIAEQHPSHIIAYCNRGITSERAILYLKSNLNEPNVELKDIVGGYSAYRP